MANAPERTNPYLGPRAFGEQEAALFFGRDREAEALLALTLAERVVALCSPSGAGKTSLVQARLVPDLRREGFSVLPIVRVGRDLPDGAEPLNVYTFNALTALTADAGDPRDLEDQTLKDFFSRPASPPHDELAPRVLIIDQFEEILTTHPERSGDRRPFFLDLRAAVQADPTLTVLLVLREDHLAALDPYARLLPGQLRTRLRIESLRRDDALEAVRKPAELAGRPFAYGVAEQLVENLSRQRRAGSEETFPGDTVEPVQLQVVCYQLWENLRCRPGDEITAQDRADFGDIDRALETFYESAVKRAADKGVSEDLIREWCGRRLITSTGIRGQVTREPEASGGLPNAAVDALVDSHLVNAQPARGGVWYELAHDRFIKPVLDSNERAAPELLRRLRKDAQTWRDRGKDASYLYRGAQLAAASATADKLGELVPDLERDFLTAAHREEVAARGRARQTRLLIVGVATLGVLLLVLVSLALKLRYESRRSHSRELASAAIRHAEADPDLGLRLALAAATIKETPEARAALHETLRLSEVRPRGTAIKVAPNTSGVVSVHGEWTAAVGLDGRLAIWATGDRRLALAPEHLAAVTAIAFDPSGSHLASSDAAGRVILWNASSGKPLRSLDAGSPVNALAFSPDARWLAAATDKPRVPIWDISGTTGVTHLSAEHGGAVLDVAFDSDGARIATADEDGRVIVWSAESRRPILPPLQHPQAVHRVAFGPGLLATACNDFAARIWNLRSPSKSADQTFYHRGEVWDVAFSPDNQQLATASSDGLARIWDLRSGIESRVIDPGAGEVRRIAFAAGGDLLTAAEERESDSEAYASLAFWKITPAALTLPRVASVLGLVGGGGAVATVEKDGWLHFWDLKAERPRLSRDLGPFSLDGLRAAAFEGRVAIGNSKGEIGLIDLHDEQEPLNRHSHAGAITALALSRLLLATAGRDKSIELWSLARPRNLRTLHSSDVSLALSFSPDGTWLAGCGALGTISLWQTATGKAGPTLEGPQNPTACVDLEISPDGRMLASGGKDGTFTVWELKNGRSLLTRKAHAREVTNILFSPDSRTLVSTGPDRMVRIWNIAEGREQFALPSRQDVEDLTYSEQGALVIVERKGTVRREPLPLSDLVKSAESRRPRRLDDEECRLYLHTSWFRACPQGN